MRRTTKMTGRGGLAEKALASAGSLLPQPEQSRPDRQAPLPWDETPDAPFVEAGDEPEEAAEETEEPAAAPVEGSEGEDNHGADDALALYLRKMGPIPLLNRQQELSLAQRLEEKRRRFRRAA